MPGGGGGGPSPCGYSLAIDTDVGSSAGTIIVTMRPSGAFMIRFIIGTAGALSALSCFCGLFTSPRMNHMAKPTKNRPIRSSIVLFFDGSAATLPHGKYKT